MSIIARLLPAPGDLGGALLRTAGLALMWAALYADSSVGALTSGVLVAIGVQAVFPSMAPRPTARINLVATARLTLVFSWMLITSNLSVLKRILSPHLDLHPLIVDVDLPTCSDAVATVVANAITLTPGTLTLDVARHDDGVGLLVHALDSTDPDAIRADALRLHALASAAFPGWLTTLEGDRLMLDLAIFVGGIGLTAAAGLCVLHIARARSFADRLVATDLLLGIIVTGFVLSSIATGTTTLLPLAVVTSLLGFVATTAAARFIETRGCEVADMHPVVEALVAFLILSGVGMSVAAAIGLRRFPDVLTRMHATSKPSMLGVICVLVAAAIVLGVVDAAMKLALVAALQLVTTPTGSHMVGRAVWATDLSGAELASPSGQGRD